MYIAPIRITTLHNNTKYSIQRVFPCDMINTNMIDIVKSKIPIIGIIIDK